MKVCIVGASGKLGQYMVQHCLDKGYKVVGVCRSKSVDKLDKYKNWMTRLKRVSGFSKVIPGGPWFVEATLKKARVRDYRYGAGMLEIPF